MKILYFDCFAGISGDMTLGALVDLGVDPNYLINELKKLPMSNEFELKIYKSQKMGITGTKVDVILYENEHLNHYNHNNNNIHHEHHEHHNHQEHHEHHEHRNLFTIQSIINNSSLNQNVKDLSNKIFIEVAIAEAKVHNKPVNEVHFHEVGSVDSIVDIVGAAICIDKLGVDKIMSSTVELGGGFVKCAHGVIPVPAPATIQILKNVPVHLGRVNSETTTPTGAAILKANVELFKDELDFAITKIGYGLGTKDFSIPNILRVYIGETNTNHEEVQIIIETNLDDMNPEFFEHVESLLFKAGARDVYKTNIIMKKSRPGIMLSVLTDKESLSDIEKILYLETTTLGIRSYEVTKKELKREYEKLLTPFGEMTIKKGYLNGKLVKTKFEYEECKRIAKEHQLPIKEVYNRLERLLHKE